MSTFLISNLYNSLNRLQEGNSWLFSNLSLCVDGLGFDYNQNSQLHSIYLLSFVLHARYVWILYKFQTYISFTYLIFYFICNSLMNFIHIFYVYLLDLTRGSDHVGSDQVNSFNIFSKDGTLLYDNPLWYRIGWTKRRL